MNTNNTVVDAALANLSAAAHNRAVQQAGTIISRIQNVQAQAAATDKAVAELQVQLKALENDTITFESVVGQTPGTTANTATIGDVIEKLNKIRQDGVRNQASELAAKIECAQKTSANLNKDVARLREELAKVSVETVDTTAILG